VYKFHRCQRFITSQFKRPKLGSKWRAKSIPKCALVWRTGHVRCTTEHPTVPVRCTRGLHAELLCFGNFQRHSAIIHRTVRCTPDSVRCSKEEPPLELASLGKTQRLLRYNSPDMSGVHRTVRCNSGATAISAPTATCSAFNARQTRAEVRHARAGTPDIEQYMSGVHRTSRRAQKVRTPTVKFQRLW
jgi:hypothetical protein